MNHRVTIIQSLWIITTLFKWIYSSKARTGLQSSPRTSSYWSTSTRDTRMQSQLSARRKKQSMKSSARSSPHIPSHPSFVMMSQHSPRRLCDESAFTSKIVLNTLTSHNVSLRIITEQRHSALSIVDRFIRTLRDMNTPTVKTQNQSTHPKYRDFSVKRMNKSA